MANAGTLSSVLPPIHRAGWPFIAAFFAASVALGWFWGPLFWLGLLATAWCVYFFRDPARVTPDDPALIVSPADGLVVTTAERVPPPELELGAQPLPCIGIFMNVFDVHVNRTPAVGTVVRRAYHPGKFLNASFDKASDENERQSFKIRTHSGREIGLVQIAGLVARRIVPFVGEGASLTAGERVGLIRFGSRCDVYLPQGVELLVLVGQRTLAGETVLADLFGNQPKRQGSAT
jgi:phosphatidylserine decarboxylase